MEYFKGKVIIITGASRGIGRQLALDLGAKGAKLILIARSVDLLNEVKRQAGNNALVVKCDVSDKKHVDSAVKAALKRFRRIDILVNCAGYGSHAPVRDFSNEGIEQMTAVNYLGTVYFCKAVLPVMERQHSGTIVNIASVAGKLAIPRSAAYCATKHAVIGFSHSLRLESRCKGISVSVICPGAVRTNFFDNYKHNSLWKTLPMLSASDVSNAIQRAIIHHTPEITLPGWLSFIVWLKGAFSPVTSPLFDFFAERL